MTDLPTVRRRLVVFLPGFEAMPSEVHAKRFLREARRAAPVFGLSLSEEIAIEREDDGVVVQVALSSPTGETATELRIHGMEDIGGLYAARDPLSRLVTGYLALVDFIVTGTMFRFARTSWRYLIYFLYPLLLPFLAGGVAWLAWLAAERALGGTILAAAAGAGAAALVLWFGLRRLHLMLVLDDWTFARDLAYGRQPAFGESLDRLAAEIARRAGTGGYEEIVVAAHSLGAIPAVSLVARLAKSQQPLPPLNLLTAGSSLMKIALHPAAEWLRHDVEAVGRAGVPWLEAQSLTDPIHFYKSHPLASLGIPDTGTVSVLRVRFRDQLEPSRYRRMKFDFFAVHRQFVGGVDRLSRYSFHAMLCGPEPFGAIARRPGLSIRTIAAERVRTGVTPT